MNPATTFSPQIVETFNHFHGSLETGSSRAVIENL